MQVIITGRVADSAGTLENGRIEFAQAQRIDTGELLVTSNIAVAQVVEGELRTRTGEQFRLPVNPEGSAVRVREILGGQTFEWWTAVPNAESVEYRELPILELSSVPESVWGPPPWVVQVQQMRDETVEAIQEGVEIANALGGLSGIQALLTEADEAATRSGVSAAESAGSAATASADADRAEAAAGTAAADAAAGVLAATSAQADRAKTEADRAQAVADSIDVTSINQRLDGMDTNIAGKASKQYVDDAVAGAVASSPDLVSQIRYPLYIAHRGSMRVYPEHSAEAYRKSFEAGFTPEADVRALANGRLVCIHDATTNRTMTVSKTVSAMTEAEWRSASVKPPINANRIYASGEGTPMFFEDYLDEFGGKIALWPEIKVTGAPADAAIKAVTDRGLQRAVVIQSADFATCQKIVAAGCHALLLSDSMAAATIKNAGIEYVGVSMNATQAYVGTLTSAGLKAIAYTPNTKKDADAQFAKGCVGVFSDDPWEVSRQYPAKTTLDFSDGWLEPAMNHNREHSGITGGPGGGTQVVYVDKDALFFDQASETRALPNVVKLGAFGQDLGGSVTVRFWAESISTRQTTGNPETSWLVGIYLGKQTDDVAVNEEANDSMWRLAMIRRNGEKNVYEKRTMTGSISKIGTVAAPSTPYAKPGGRSVPMLFEVEFTPTAVTIRNLTLNDTDCVATGTALTVAGAYLSLNVNGSSSRVWGISVKKG